MYNKYEELKNTFYKVLSEYADVYDQVKKNEDWKNSFRDLISKRLPELINECADIQKPYKVVGSYGKGRWTSVPWISIFDERITTSAQNGVYIVYLFNKDKKELYLTLNQGATNVIYNDDADNKTKHSFVGVAGSSNQKNLELLKQNAKTIREVINDNCFDSDSNINTGSPNYDAGTIYYKKYRVNDFPSGQVIIDDLKRMIGVYSKYEMNTHIEWWPSLSEYDPGISKEQWLELLNDGTTFTDNALLAFAAMYDFGGTASCVQLENHYGKTSDFYRMAMGVHIPNKVHKKLGIPFCVEEEKEWLWPIPFVGRSAGKEEPGSYIWKLRSELHDALEEFNITEFLPKTGTESPMTQFTTKEIIDTIKDYIASKGFTYEEGVIENFYLSLKSKPFVILAGTSGTGKSKLVELFAEAIGAEYKPVAVRPDWSDSSDLFGHLDLNGKYIKGAILEFIHEAQNDPDKPYILCMDEMNLARVEYYLSDFLSIIETRKHVDGVITTKPLVSIENYGDDWEAKDKYGEIIFPENLYLVGTVNMDETTFPFSKKVLDRANTIEFDYVDLLPPKDGGGEQVEALELSNGFLKTKYLILNQCNDKDYIKDICLQLEELNKELRLSNAHVGYRVRDEIVFYMLNNKEAGLLGEDEAFDYEIMQKILPRIQGSASSIKDMLIKLYEYCSDKSSSLDAYAKDLGETMCNLAPSAKYKLSAAKIGFMMKRYEEDGFTSYWL